MTSHLKIKKLFFASKESGNREPPMQMLFLCVFVAVAMGASAPDDGRVWVRDFHTASLFRSAYGVRSLSFCLWKNQVGKS
jgi:hypothetical protein